MSNLEKKVKAYSGDGEISFQERKGWTSEGVRIAFPSFSLKEHYSGTYKIKNLPIISNDYVVGLEFDALKPSLKPTVDADISIKAFREDGSLFFDISGRTISNRSDSVNDRDWIWSSSGPTYYFLYHKKALKYNNQSLGGVFTKEFLQHLGKDKTIVLKIDYYPHNVDDKIEGRFVVKAGGYK